ncbi:MAG: H-NS histone family protein [Pseudomonadota bacterium]
MSKRPAKASRGGVDYEAMPVKDLLEIQARVNRAISIAKERERAEVKQKIEELASSSGFSINELMGGRSTKGKTVAPKYMNPDNTSETWTGRGRKPRWLVAKLDKGAKMDDFKI